MTQLLLHDGGIRDNLLKFILRTEIYLQDYRPACEMIVELLKTIGPITSIKQLNPIRRAKKKKRAKGDLEDGEIDDDEEDDIEMELTDPRYAPYSRFSANFQRGVM